MAKIEYKQLDLLDLENKKSSRIVLMDGNSMMYKAYWGMPNLSSKSGHPTGAVYGLYTMINKVCEILRPTHFAIAFDRHAPTFRHKMYAEYKAGRATMPPDLLSQVPLIKEMLSKRGIKTLEIDGYEADDIIGTLSERLLGKKTIISGDKDLLQLVSDDTTVWISRTGVTDVSIYTYQKMLDNNFLPEDVITYKSLAGDSSDNIKGVPGIGDVSAKKLIEKYKTLDSIYEHINELSGSTYKKIVEGKESAYLSQTLATIFRDVPIECELDDITYNDKISEELISFFKQLDISTF